jgi:clan AA aspartic protease
MGTFRHRIELAATPEGPFEAIDALVDSGATYALVPRSMLERLGVQAVDRQTFVIADGNRIERDVGQATVRIDGRSRASVVIFGDEGVDPLLGAVTLEEFGLRVDPIARRLIPVPGYLVGFGLGEL